VDSPASFLIGRKGRLRTWIVFPVSRSAARLPPSCAPQWGRLAVTTASRQVAAATAPTAQPGRVLGLTRAGVWVLFLLAAANGLFL
jgi:hypothetical protein